MKDPRNKGKETEDKYERYKKDVLNERMFLFRLNNLFTNEFEELIEDILILNETQFFIQIKNRVEAELEEIYSENIFSDKKFSTLIEKGLNSIKSDYNQNLEFLNNVYNTYTKNRMHKNDKIKFLTAQYRRHCVNEIDNEYAAHTCSARLGKFILAEKNGKTEFLICANCKKVYYDSMILCKCYKCNIEYYTELFVNNENEFILPATWDNYHCKQISKEKIKCIKCRELLYINLKTNMLICQNKNCNFSTKPDQILWTCSICNQDFKSGAMPYNPLDLEVIKKIIRQTLYLKQYAHPNKVPCCKLNVFFTEFYHKKKCEGVLYTGELNQEVIIVCERCHAVNFYERFIWTCPRCGNKFRDESKKENNLSDDNSDKNDTFKSNEDVKKNDKENNEDVSSNSNNSKNRYSNENKKNKSIQFKDTSDFNLDKKTNKQQNIQNDNSKNIEEHSMKKTKSSRFKRRLNNIYYEREKEKKEKETEKEIIESNIQTEISGDKKEQIPEKNRKRSRFFSNTTTENKEPQQEQEKDNDGEKAEEDNNKTDQRRKIEKTPLNIFTKFRKNRKSENHEQNEGKKEEQEQQEKPEKELIIKVNKKSENLEEDKEKLKIIPFQKNYPKSSKRIAHYRSFKRNTANNLKQDIESLNILNKNDKKEEEKEKNAEKEENVEPKRLPRKRFFSNNPQFKDSSKNPPKNNKVNQKIEDEEEVEEEDLSTKKRSKKDIEQNKEIKSEEITPGFNSRWKFRRPETKKTLGKEIKEETASTSKTNSIQANNTANNGSNKSNNSNEENTNHSQSPEKNESNNTNETKKKNIKMSKIQGMTENLYNHVMKRISNITAKCSIPMMNVEDYTLTQKIGEGSYGIIFKAVSKKDNQQFALKKIISNKLQKIGEFIKEFELVYSCHHENIMKIYSYCIRILDSTTYALYVLMELSEGDWDKEIRLRLMQGKNYTEKELVNILFQLSSSLLYMEQNFHISHRDIKPQNVLVFPGGKYKMADFGEAKEAKIMRQRNTLRGTELYMSPALYAGLKHELNDVSHNPFKSDVFSLGFCFIYAAALNFNLLYQVRDVIDNKNINMMLHKFLSKYYSENFITLLISMLEMDESKRFDFIDIKTFIEKNFGDMIK